MKKLYLFDFDGTLTHKDTMFLFLKFYSTRKFYLQFVKHIPLFILLKTGLADAEKVKKSFIASVLKGERKTSIQKKAHDFFEKHGNEILRENALEFIKKIDRAQTQSYIVTASLDIWVQPFADSLKMKLLATQAEFRNQIFTGNFVGKNCNGDEKRCRIENELAGKKFDKTLAFGDTQGDRQMMDWADESHYRFFH